jgi:hypothetical protein
MTDAGAVMTMHPDLVVEMVEADTSGDTGKIRVAFDSLRSQAIEDGLALAWKKATDPDNPGWLVNEKQLGWVLYLDPALNDKHVNQLLRQAWHEYSAWLLMTKIEKVNKNDLHVVKSAKGRRHFSVTHIVDAGYLSMISQLPSTFDFDRD